MLIRVHLLKNNNNYKIKTQINNKKNYVICLYIKNQPNGGRIQRSKSRKYNN